MEKQEVVKKIREICIDADRLYDEKLAEAEALADQYGVEFSVGDYGYGRTYYPNNDKWRAENPKVEGWYGLDNDSRWYPK